MILSPDDGGPSFDRDQFPVQPGFLMIIYKYQTDNGQMIIYLAERLVKKEMVNSIWNVVLKLAI